MILPFCYINNPEKLQLHTIREGFTLWHFEEWILITKQEKWILITKQEMHCFLPFISMIATWSRNELQAKELSKHLSLQFLIKTLFLSRAQNEVLNSSNQNMAESMVPKQCHTMSCLKIVSDNCIDITGATSAGLPGRTSGEQIGGMWKSMAVNNKYQQNY